jgi:hypothetical protein
MERNWSSDLATFLVKLQQESFDEWKERGMLSFPEREIMKKLVSQERFIRIVKAA